MSGPPPVLRTVGAAALSTVLGSLPVFLLGGLAVLVGEELGLGELQLGLAVSVFFTAAAVAAVPAGRLVARLGARRSTVAAALVSAVTLLVCAAAPGYAVLVAALAVAGAGNALAQIGSNEALARVVPPRRQGLAFGIKQSAVPAATLLAGLALPVLGLTLGWRAAFAGAALVAVGCVALAPADAPAAPRAPGSPAPAPDPERGPLVVVALAAALGSGAAGGLGAFLVVAAVQVGLSPGQAGLLLAAGSGLSVAVRLAAGWDADRRTGGHLTVVTAMLGSGALGMALLATGSPALLLPAVVLAFALGWGWPGLLNLAVVRLHPSAPAAATSVSQGGVFLGAALGPVLFGLVVELASFRAAWSAAAVALLAAAGLMRVGRRLLEPAPAGAPG